MICFRVCVTTISDKTDKPLLNYSNLYWGASGAVVVGHCAVDIRYVEKS